MLIIHVIGKVGAGKTTFIEKYLSQYPCFDIKKIYEQTGFTSNNLSDIGDYTEFNNNLYQLLSQKIRTAIDSQTPLIIESSGMNQYLNKVIYLIKDLDLYQIWVDCEIADRIYDERPYAERINKLFQTKIVNGHILFHTRFDWDVKYFTVTPPDHVLALNPKLKECIL